MITFTIPGQPQGKARPKIVKIGGFSRITFVPNGVGGYTYFVGTR